MKKLTSILLIFIMIISFSITSMAEVVRNETVYVNLGNDGNIKNLKVVSHLSGESDEDFYIDYGKLNNLKVLTKDIEPIIENNLLKWETKSLKDKDIFYEGSTDKKLPLDIRIKYFLDNKEIEGKDLGGKSGDIKISIKIENSHDLTTQIQVPFNLDLFKDFQSEEGVVSVVGKTMTIVFTHLPMGDKEYTIKARGRNIELDPITIVSTDSSDLMASGIGGIDELIDGMKDISKAAEEMEDGSDKLANGSGKFKDGLKVLSDGIEKLVNGVKEIGTNLKTIVNGFNEFNFGFGQLKDSANEMVKSIDTMNNGLKQLANEGENIEKGILGLNNGLKEIGGGIDNLSQGLNGLNMGHKELTELAKSLVNSQDPRVKALAEGVIKEGMALEELSGGLSGTNEGMKSIVENTASLANGYGEYNKGLGNISTGFNQLNEGIKLLPQEINTMYEGHNQLVEGLNALNAGMENLVGGADELNRGAKSLPEEVGKIVDGQNKLTEGLNELNEKGLKKITKSVESFLNPDEEQKEKFTSFVDERNKANSNVQILMQTEGIKIEKKLVEIQEEEIVKKTIFERFLDLFKFGKN